VLVWQLADSVRLSLSCTVQREPRPHERQCLLAHVIIFTLAPTHTHTHRALTWAVIAVAFGFSLASLHACDFIQGHTVFFDLAPEDWRPLPKEEGDANEVTVVPTIVPNLDPYTVAIRNAPNYQSSSSFSLGVFKFSDESTVYGTECLDYANGFSEKYLDAGSAEGAARFFGCLAAALGGLSMVVLFGLAASDVKKKIYNTVLTWILSSAAFCQMLIFSLFGSKHCGDQFWADFLSLQEQWQETDNSTTCEMGDGGWFALVAFILFLLAAILVATKWADPVYTVFSMEWTKNHIEEDPNNMFGNISGQSDLESGSRQQQKHTSTTPLHPVVQETDDEDELEHVQIHHHASSDPTRPDPSALVVESTPLNQQQEI